MASGRGSTDQNDRAGGARSDERPVGKGGAPSEFARQDHDGEDGCGNAVPMETKERFHRDLEISQRTRDSHIPTSRSLFVVRNDRRTRNR
jgi:hypothetical protein